MATCFVFYLGSVLCCRRKRKRGKDGKMHKTEDRGDCYCVTLWLTVAAIGAVCAVCAVLGLAFKFTSHLHTMVVLAVSHHLLTLVDMVLGSGRTAFLVRTFG